ncbi:type II secretion system protein GspK [Colwellia sp. 1_MG-2023]|uniref:type II secretion system protein GspK n=1 Tax=Colwellia sp. 1_MG-2023 TaxID=3062649 RepID=UPI0026E36B2B|nr:type II secretion system protein GspK [Colwellia sp. 1_MG-2023]MDO6444334.1 type II secretion system protein GspK [Colwellia sp. 1_MG-2023]
MLNLFINKQKGIALIQVLIIAIILSMLGIFINQSVRNQVKVAQLIQNNQKLDLILESVEAELLHTLLTHKRYKNIESDNELVKKWNFHGETFKLNEQVSITLQDLNGLLSLNYMNNKLSTRLFELLGNKDDSVRTFLDSLKDWKDKDDLKHLNGAESDYYNKLNLPEPRNSYLQSMDEVNNIKEAKVLSKEQWNKYYSLELLSQFNPLNSPLKLLEAFVNNELAFSQLKTLREENQLNAHSFYRITGIDAGDNITLSTGRVIRVKILIESESNQLNKNFQVILRPNANKRPITLSNIEWNK